ncbi:MAG: MFS transporter [Granulosicoccus sp.]
MTGSGGKFVQANKASKVWFKPGDSALIGIMVSDFFNSIAGTMVYLTMLWWVLAQGASELGVTLLVLCIYVPLNAGVIFSGVAVARFGARRLLLVSKALAVVGAAACYTLLAADLMTLWVLALLAVFVYGSMGPSQTADVSRAPALIRLSKRKLASFNAANGIAVVLGSVIGLTWGGFLSEASESATAIAISMLLVTLSFGVTFASFPRDRVLPNYERSSVKHLMVLTRSVMDRLDNKSIGLGSILITAALITVSEGIGEVLLPIELRASELSPTALSDALVYVVVGSVIAYVVAQAIHGKVNLDVTLVLTGAVLSIILVIGTYYGGWIALTIGAVAATSVASATALLAFTSIQLHMPASLQAQAAGLWHSLVLTSSALVIFLTGLAKAHGFVFLACVTICASVFAAYHLRR